MMTFSQINIATLDQLTDELAAAGINADGLELQQAREGVVNLLLECGDLAKAMGYESISWDDEYECYSGFGSSDPTDRSRDDAGGYLIAGDIDDLVRVAERVMAK